MIKTLETVAAADVAAQLESQLRKRLASDPVGSLLLNALTDIFDTLAGGLSGGLFLAPFDDVVAEGTARGRIALAQIKEA